MGLPAYLAASVVAYLLGSIPSGVMATRAFARRDLHAVGSGHIGTLNTLRAAGLLPAVLTLLADGAKGALAVALAQQFAGGGWAVPLAATLVVAGHIVPLFTRGRGGMGLATAGGVFFVLQPFALAGLIVAWFPLKRLLHESFYASLAVAALLPLLLVVLRADIFTVAAGAGVGAVLFLRHAQVLFDRSRY